MTEGTPNADWRIDEDLVHSLLDEQHPDLAEAEIRPLDTGWDNVMFRLGEDLLVRLPRRQESIALIEHEQEWLPLIAARLPLPVPVPVRVGRPGRGYPSPWSIVPWLPGVTANINPIPATEAERWARFLCALHQGAPDDAPRNEFRGVPLKRRMKAVEARLDRLRDAAHCVPSWILDLWHQARDAPEADRSSWLHGDLHERNVLVERGRIRGVIDWGDVTSGDAATDLASVWMLFGDAQARADCIGHYRPSSSMLARAQGWAISFAVALLETGLVDHPAHAAMGRTILRRLSQDAGIEY